MSVRRVQLSEVIPLRQRVLRPGQPVEASHYPADPSAVHFGFEHEGEIVCVITAHPEVSPLGATARRPWRIRGMATEEAFQGRGFGSRVLKELLSWARGEGVDLLWCNAREKAIPFYERQGFVAESPLFELPLIGPHRVLQLRLA